jgi:hypothetical protein
MVPKVLLVPSPGINPAPGLLTRLGLRQHAEEVNAARAKIAKHIGWHTFRRSSSVFLIPRI